jgi:hypothetical protein
MLRSVIPIMVVGSGFALSACGGSVVEDPGSSAGGSSGGVGDGGGLPKTPLPPCELGDPPGTQGASCAWIANNLCYDEREAACACECRRTKGTVCVSGFPGFMVDVTCP